MFVIIGIVVVFGSVIGGFLMEKGNLGVLVQPAEFIIIVGSAVGALFIGASPKVVKAITRNITTIIQAKSQSKGKYLELLSLLYHLFSKIRKEGLISVESDIENPVASPLFNTYNSVMGNGHAINFICDNLKVIIATNVPSHELEGLMDLEIDTWYEETSAPPKMIAKVADSLPGLGIVAAVLGVVLTMSNIDKPPAVLGHSIGAALVGTFLGVFLCYGLVSPLASNMEHRATDDTVYFQVIKVAVVSFVRGAAPQMAVEFARRAIPSEERPTFDELESEVRGKTA